MFIDNVPKGAQLLYDCNADAIPQVCQIKLEEDGIVLSKMIDAQKTSPRRYLATLYKINGSTLLGIAKILRGMEQNKVDMWDVRLCICGDEIGLIKHSK